MLVVTACFVVNYDTLIFVHQVLVHMIFTLLSTIQWESLKRARIEIRKCLIGYFLMVKTNLHLYFKNFMLIIKITECYNLNNKVI